MPLTTHDLRLPLTSRREVEERVALLEQKKKDAQESLSDMSHKGQWTAENTEARLASFEVQLRHLALHPHPRSDPSPRPRPNLALALTTRPGPYSDGPSPSL